MKIEEVKRLMTLLDEIREDLTAELEYGCTDDEADLLCGIITDLANSIDDIGIYIAEAEE